MTPAWKAQRVPVLSMVFYGASMLLVSQYILLYGDADDIVPSRFRKAHGSHNMQQSW